MRKYIIPNIYIINLAKNLLKYGEECNCKNCYYYGTYPPSLPMCYNKTRSNYLYGVYIDAERGYCEFFLHRRDYKDRYA